MFLLEIIRKLFLEIYFLVILRNFLLRVLHEFLMEIAQEFFPEILQQVFLGILPEFLLGAFLEYLFNIFQFLVEILRVFLKIFFLKTSFWESSMSSIRKSRIVPSGNHLGFFSGSSPNDSSRNPPRVVSGNLPGKPSGKSSSFFWLCSWSFFWKSIKSSFWKSSFW